MSETDIKALLARIDQALGLLHMSDREASLKATGKPDAIREIRRGKWPSDRRLRQIAAALESTMGYLLTGEGGADRGMLVQHLPPSKLAEMDGVEGLPRDVPVYGPTQFSLKRSNEPHKVQFGYEFRFACRPPVIRNRDDVYCIMMPDWSLSPRYEVGDELYIDPRRLPGVGDYVLVRFVEGDDATSSDWSLLIRKLVGISSDNFSFLRHDTGETSTYSEDKIWMLQRVFPWGELLAY